VAAALPNVPDAGAAPVAEAPHAYGIANTRARIIIRAVGDSWVQVRDENSVPIFTRQLHAGDSYRVPDRPGLSLRTGKGTALAITVDGRAVPAIGGGVHSNVLLDTERLLAGTAVVPASRPSPAPPVTSGVAPETTPATTE
jgi:cytoskeleton protein RodZ